jgi:hypothetical protein
MDLNEFKKNNKEILKKDNKKVGRNPISVEQRKSEIITTYLTKSEKAKINKISKKQGGLPLTILLRNALKKADLI